MVWGKEEEKLVIEKIINKIIEILVKRILDVVKDECKRENWEKRKEEIVIGIDKIVIERRNIWKKEEKEERIEFLENKDWFMRKRIEDKKMIEIE